MSKDQIAWKKKPEREDNSGTLNYLSLIFPTAKSASLLRELRTAKSMEHAAKDLLRASNLPVLPRDDPQVDDEIKKIQKGKHWLPYC